MVIKSFKGFGVELETSLNKPVANIGLSVTEAMVELQVDEKRSINYLRSLSEKDKKRISRLVLVQGRHNFYSPNVLGRYIIEIRGLKYIEIRNSSGMFVALIPISKFKPHGDMNSNLLREFIRALEQSQVIQLYSISVISEHVTDDTGLIESLKKMRRKKIQQLVVLDENGVFMGLLLSRAVEKRIIDNVLTAKVSV